MFAFRYAPPMTAYTDCSSAIGLDWMSSVQWYSSRKSSNDFRRFGFTVMRSTNSQ